MLGRTYEGQLCSVARALEVVGERWTLLIVRDAFLGVRRFDDFQRSLGIARNVLQVRLERLVDQGVLARRLYQERPRRVEYVLTEMGTDLWPTIHALLRWGDRHLAPAGVPRVVEHRDCGGEVVEDLSCGRCGQPLAAGMLAIRPGPGAPADRDPQTADPRFAPSP